MSLVSSTTPTFTRYLVPEDDTIATTVPDYSTTS